MFRGNNEGKKILTSKWNEQNRQIHYKKLKNMRGLVDTSCPQTYGALRHKPKKEQILEDRFTEIERENRILLEKMSQIVNSRSQRSASNNRRRSLNAEARQRQNVQIVMENQALLKRLQDKQPSYSVYRWEEERRSTEKRLKNICEFPYTLGNEELPKKPSEVRTRNSSRSRKIIRIPDQVPRNPRKLSPITRKKQITVFKKGMTVGDKHFIVEIQKKNNQISILAFDIESPESFCLEMTYDEALELMNGQENYAALAGMLGIEEGDLILIDSRQEDVKSATQRNIRVKETDIIVEKGNMFEQKKKNNSFSVGENKDLGLNKTAFIERDQESSEEEQNDYDYFEEEGDKDPVIKNEEPLNVENAKEHSGSEYSDDQNEIGSSSSSLLEKHEENQDFDKKVNNQEKEEILENHIKYFEHDQGKVLSKNSSEKSETNLKYDSKPKTPEIEKYSNKSSSSEGIENEFKKDSSKDSIKSEPIEEVPKVKSRDQSSKKSDNESSGSESERKVIEANEGELLSSRPQSGMVKNKSAEFEAKFDLNLGFLPHLGNPEHLPEDFLEVENPVIEEYQNEIERDDENIEKIVGSGDHLIGLREDENFGNDPEENEKFNKKEILGDVDEHSENEKNSVHLEDKSDSSGNEIEKSKGIEKKSDKDSESSLSNEEFKMKAEENSGKVENFNEKVEELSNKIDSQDEEEEKNSEKEEIFSEKNFLSEKEPLSHEIKENSDQLSNLLEKKSNHTEKEDNFSENGQAISDKEDDFPIENLNIENKEIEEKQEIYGAESIHLNKDELHSDRETIKSKNEDIKIEKEYTSTVNENINSENEDFHNKEGDIPIENLEIHDEIINLKKEEIHKEKEDTNSEKKDSIIENEDNNIEKEEPSIENQDEKIEKENFNIEKEVDDNVKEDLIIEKEDLVEKENLNIDRDEFIDEKLNIKNEPNEKEFNQEEEYLSKQENFIKNEETHFERNEIPDDNLSVNDDSALNQVDPNPLEQESLLDIQENPEKNIKLEENIPIPLNDAEDFPSESVHSNIPDE